MSDFPSLNANIDLNADLTKPVEDITGIAKETHKGLKRLSYWIMGPTMENRIGVAKRIAAQTEKDCQDILAGKKEYDIKTGRTIPTNEISTLEALCSELERVDSACKAKRL